MQPTPYILISIIVLLIIIGLLVVFLKRKSRRPTDYYSLFVIGLIWLIVGLPMDNYALTTMGLIFTILGLVNRDKWKKNRVHWKDLGEDERRMKTILIIVAGFLLLLGVVTYFAVENGVI